MAIPQQHIQQVGDLMTGDLIALRPVDTVARAERVLTEFNLHMLPVVDRMNAVGVVTLADCHGFAPTSELSEVIRRPPVTIDVAAPVVEAAQLMREEYIHHLLVTDRADGSEELVGVLSSLDLLKTLAG